MSVTRMLMVVCLALSFSAMSEEDNPYRNAKVGDWTECKTSTSMSGFNMDGKMKQTVIAKSETEVTVKIESEVNGQKNSQETKIDLTKKFVPGETGLPSGTKAPKIEQNGSGDEKVTVGAKTYDAHWTAYKMAMEVGPLKMNMNVKTWTSKDVPLEGMVKSEMSGDNGMKTTVELVGSGRGQ